MMVTSTCYGRVLKPQKLKEASMNRGVKIGGQVTFFIIWFLSPLRVFSVHAFLPFSRGLFLSPSVLTGI